MLKKPMEDVEISMGIIETMERAHLEINSLYNGITSGCLGQETILSNQSMA